LLFAICYSFVCTGNFNCNAIYQNQRSLNISSLKNFRVTEVKTGKITPLFKGNSYLVLPFQDGIKIRERVFDGFLKFWGTEKLNVNGKNYRGIIYVENKGGKLNCINNLDIEDYLKGVLPAEVSPSWHIEALKAQAVVSRTYAFKNLGRFFDRGFDLCSTQISQVYKGADVEKEQTNLAVDVTKGEVLFYKGEVAKVFFHADAGGYTENPKYVWNSGEVPRYLKGVREPRFLKSPYSKWKCKIFFDDLEKKLVKNGYDVGKIFRLKASDRTPSGRYKKIIVYSKKGKVKIPSNRFRTIVGSSKMRSTKIKRIKNKRKYAEIFGAGWGHGVGFSQWGAKALAEKGWSYRKILQFYFPGTRIRKSEGGKSPFVFPPFEKGGNRGDYKN